MQQSCYKLLVNRKVYYIYQMTTKEQQTIDSLLQSVRDLREENRMFRNDITELVTAINGKTEKKFVPITLEQDILQATQGAIHDSIKSVLSGYNSPLSKLVTSVVDENSTQLRGIISDSFNAVINTAEFKQSIVSAFSHKVARTIISNNDGLFDKVSNELKQDVQFKTKMQQAVINVVNECLIGSEVNHA